MTDEAKRVIKTLRRKQVESVEITTYDFMGKITLSEVAGLIEHLSAELEYETSRGLVRWWRRCRRGE